MDLFRHELTPRGRLDHQPPACTWDYLGAKRGDIALITCSRGHVTRMVDRVHRVAPDGTVSPSYVCTIDGCDFHQFIRLVGYDPDAG